VKNHGTLRARRFAPPGTGVTKAKPPLRDAHACLPSGTLPVLLTANARGGERNTNSRRIYTIQTGGDAGTTATARSARIALSARDRCRCRATRATAWPPRAPVAATRAGSNRSLDSRAVCGVSLDLAPRAFDAAGDEARLAASGLRRTPHDLTPAALVNERHLRLIRGTAHVGTVGERATVAVGGNRRAGVGDVRLVGVGARVARGMARSGADE